VLYRRHMLTCSAYLLHPPVAATHYRDDIVFFIYLYQRWIYRIDHTRVNEYGQTSQIQQDAANSTVNTTSTTTAASAGSTASDEAQQHLHSS
jgi:hypothetical protein